MAACPRPFAFFLILERRHEAHLAAPFQSILHRDKPDCVIHQCRTLGFVTCGSNVQAQTDVCLKDDYLLLVQEDKEGLLSCLYSDKLTAVSSWIAMDFSSGSRASTTILCNSCVLLEQSSTFNARLCQLALQDSVGIPLIGTAAIFYRILVIARLVREVAAGSTPTTTTIVRRRIPPMITNMLDYLTEGMGPLQNRRIVFHCFLALKTLMVCYKPLGVKHI